MAISEEWEFSVGELVRANVYGRILNGVLDWLEVRARVR